MTVGSHQLLSLQHVLKEWNRQVFGDIFIKKRDLLRKLISIDKQLARGRSVYLENLQRITWQLYEETLANEELFWFQKSRAKWLECGDRNTKYFHGVTSIHRWRNHIHSLQNNEGAWILDAIALATLATNYYKRLFTCDSPYVPLEQHPNRPLVSLQDVEALTQEVHMSELWNVVKSCGPYKAPGHDGFQAVFYQSQ